MKKQYRYYNLIIFIRLEQYENMSIDEDNMECRIVEMFDIIQRVNDDDRRGRFLQSDELVGIVDEFQDLIDNMSRLLKEYKMLCKKRRFNSGIRT